MAIFMDQGKLQDQKTPFQQLSPSEKLEVMEKVQAGDETIRKCLRMLTGAIIEKLARHGQKLTAHELTELADALGNLADTYEVLNGKPSSTES